MGVVLEGSDLVHLAAGTRMWVQRTHFSLTGSAEVSDDEVLRSLLSADGYGHDYAAPFPGRNTDGHVAVHGRWTLQSITAGSFERTTVAEAGRVIRRWSAEQDWTDPDFRQPEEVVRGLDDVIDGLGFGALYRLRDPGPECEHDYGWVTGGNGFHEFVVIDRSARRVSVVVASDD